MENYFNDVRSSNMAMGEQSFIRDKEYFDANQSVEKQQEKIGKIDAATEPFEVLTAQQGLSNLSLKALKKLGLRKSAEAIESIRKNGIVKTGIQTLKDNMNERLNEIQLPELDNEIVNPMLKVEPSLEDPRLAGVDDESMLSLQQPRTIMNRVSDNPITQAPDDKISAAQDYKNQEAAAQQAKTDQQVEQSVVDHSSGGGGDDDAGDLEAGLEETGEVEAASGGPEDVIGDIVAAGVGLASLFGTIFGSKTNHPNPVAPQINSQVGFGILSQ
jgi:hypothetical protein